MFAEVLKEITQQLFITGVPIISTSAMTENEFLYAGNLMAASILQCGPSPCILKPWVYDYVVSSLCEQLKLTLDDLPASEIKTFSEKVL